jgi:hypothetical protein
MRWSGAGPPQRETIPTLRRPGQSDIAEPGEQGAERDLGLQSGQGGAEAVVNSAAERDRCVVSTSEVQSVGVGKRYGCRLPAAQIGNDALARRYRYPGSVSFSASLLVSTATTMERQNMHGPLLSMAGTPRYSRPPAPISGSTADQEVCHEYHHPADSRRCRGRSRCSRCQGTSAQIRWTRQG